MCDLRIVLWNVQADQRTAERTRRIRARLELLEADVICLNEGFPTDIPGGTSPETVSTSALSDWAPERGGARKVILYSRFGWRDSDSEGSPLLPEGRYVAAGTHTGNTPIRVIGIAPPWHAYRATERWGARRLRTWEGNERYWEALAVDVLPHVCAPALILGDFNVQLPPRRYPMPDSRAYALCRAALDGWSIATANIPVDGHTLDKPLVCHIAHTPDIHQIDLTVFSRFDADGFELSDHPCVVMYAKVTA